MLLTTSVLKQREVPATVSSFYVSVLYTAMLRTSIAAIVLGCCYFCPLDCDASVMIVDCDASVMIVDCAAFETGYMLEKYIKDATKYVSILFFGRGAAAAAGCCCCVLLLPTTSVLKRREVLFFSFLVAALLLLFTMC